MPGTLDRWLFFRFFRAYLTFVVAITGLFLTIDFLSNAENLAARGLLDAALHRYGTMLPELFFVLSPYLSLLSGLWVVVSLERANELVPLLSAGISPRRLCVPLFAAGVLLAGASWLDREVILPALADLRRADNLRLKWAELRPIPDGEDGVLTARWYMPEPRELVEPRYVRLDPSGRERETVLGRMARFEEAAGGWRFIDAIAVRRVDGEDVIAAVGSEGLLVPSRIRVSDVEAAARAPTFLSAAQLRAQLERTPGFRQLEVQLYERFSQPLAGLMLLVVSLPLALAASGSGGAAAVYARGLALFGLGFVHFFLSSILFELGSHAVVPAAVAAFLPAGLFAVAGGILLALDRS